MPSDAGYATSSIEGRVAVEWFDASAESQARKYAFKCHRTAQATTDGSNATIDVVFPVNALAFHPVHGSTFASGGNGVDLYCRIRYLDIDLIGAACGVSPVVLVVCLECLL